MAIACLDVDYRDDHAAAAAVLFADWPDEATLAEVTTRIDAVAPYEPGRFYLRELPCLLAVLRLLPQPPTLIVIDGYVWLADVAAPGLGARLYDALGGATPVVGVAKTRFASCTVAVEVVRGETARKPLFVTSAGVDVAEAADGVRRMHGAYRVPTMPARADALCRAVSS